MERRERGKYPRVREVTDDERIGIVKEIFSTVTDSYDFLNHFLSLRLDIGWRRFAAGMMRFFETYRLLDVASGTADLAINAARRHPYIQVAGLDFVQEMIKVGRIKIEKENLPDKVHLFRGDALDLPFRDKSFDVASIAFGIRNIPDKIRALKEMNRIIVPGGQVIVLEMSSPTNRFTKKIYYLYLNRILPNLAKLFSRNPAAYHYLADSIINFPASRVFGEMMEKAGLRKVEIHSLTRGITHLFIGYKPEL